MKIIVHMPHPYSAFSASDFVAEQLRKKFPEVKFVAPSNADLDIEIQDADAVISGSLRPEQVSSAKKLKWIHSHWAAIHTLLFPELVNSDIILTNSTSVHAYPVAEQTIAAIFALAKRFPQIFEAQTRREWITQSLFQQRDPIIEIAGLTVGLFGLGHIGRDVAKMASGLGMRIVAVRERPEKGIDWDTTGSTLEHQVYGPDGLDKMLGEADFVVLAAPVTSKTKQLFNRERFQKMKQSAYLINVSRGDLIDEVAIAEALRAGVFAGAALDVFDKEPLPKDSPLWDVPKLFITPHTGGLSQKIWERHLVVISANIEPFLKG